MACWALPCWLQPSTIVRSQCSHAAGPACSGDLNALLDAQLSHGSFPVLLIRLLRHSGLSLVGPALLASAQVPLQEATSMHACTCSQNLPVVGASMPSWACSSARAASSSSSSGS